jgi:muramoyltetrapeptide carboxypeptidase LdcA involved in peptidoglycan recycling
LDGRIVGMATLASKLAALIIGRFQRASAVDRPILHQIIDRRPVLIGVPVLANIYVGHTSPLATLPIGGDIEVECGPKSRLRVVG